jgi:hypothetical protein
MRMAALRRWSGPTLAIFGLVILGVIVLRPAAPESPLTWWIINSALALERVLPLIGLGVALAIVSARAFIAALLSFLIGICFGFIAQNWLLAITAKMPQAAMHLFLTGPIASVAVGLALISGARPLPIVLPVAALVAGTMLALAIVVTDPSLHDTTNAFVGILIGLWIIASVSLTIGAFRRAWFSIFARILGSWLIAIGMLYGSAALLPVHAPPQDLPESALPPEFDKSFPDIDQNGPEPNSAPGSLRNPRQP